MCKEHSLWDDALIQEAISSFSNSGLLHSGAYSQHISNLILSFDKVSASAIFSQINLSSDVAHESFFPLSIFPL